MKIRSIGAYEHVVDLVFLAGRRKHHSHEVGAYEQIVARINVGLANGVLVTIATSVGILAIKRVRRNLALLLGIIQNSSNPG